ncbi:hypothetical protein ACVDG8_033285 [Mesorhizobium sp. ORM8.1]
MSSVVAPVCSIISLLGFSELFLFFLKQIKQGSPLELILLLGQALPKMLDIQASNPLIHSSHKQPQRLPCLYVYNIAQPDWRYRDKIQSHIGCRGSTSKTQIADA